MKIKIKMNIKMKTMMKMKMKKIIKMIKMKTMMKMIKMKTMMKMIKMKKIKMTIKSLLKIFLSQKLTNKTLSLHSKSQTKTITVILTALSMFKCIIEAA